MKENTIAVKNTPRPKCIEIDVTGVNKEEFLEAAHASSRSFFIALIVLMALFCGIIMLASNNYSFAAFLGPLVIYVVIFAGYELYIHFSYKQQLQALEMHYAFTAKSWTLEVGDSKAEIDWRGTVKLKKRKYSLFLYNDDTHSNLLPLRYISNKDLETITKWYNASRGESKDFIRAQYRLEREEQKARMKKNRKNNRFWGGGPAWGPFRRK